MSPVVAAIDCGTNSTRLLVSRGGTETVERLMTITRLGQGVDATGRLAPEAIERTVSAVRRYGEVMDHHGVERVRVTATSAARDSTNRDELFGAIEQVVGATPELLSGFEEGALSFRGATAELDPGEGPFLVVDIGGGSTEFAVGTDECTGALSVDMGCVRFTEKFLHHDPPRPEELSSALSVAEVYIDDVIREVPEVLDTRRLVGLAGTVSTVATVELGVSYSREAVHHLVLSKEAVEDVFRTLATESVHERRENPGMEHDRADVIVGGMCVLVKVMRQFGFDELLVSESDILDGLALSLVD